MITDKYINELITCAKKITSAERRSLHESNRSLRNNVNLLSSDGAYSFRMFMRQSLCFIEDFSVGLIWTNPNKHINIKKEIILFRCQGPHDGKEDIGFDIHHDFHTQTLTSDDLKSKRFHNPSKRNTENNFASFEEAVIYFEKYCAIIELNEHIDMERFIQLRLE